MDQIITLISDWKLRDAYVGMFKGTLLKRFSDLTILDITHSIDKQNYEQTAFILKNSFRSFPEKTVHLILTGLIFAPKRAPIILFYENHLFIGQDQGVFSMIMGQNSHYQAYQLLEQEANMDVQEQIWLLLDRYFKGQIEQKCAPYLTIQNKMVKQPYFDEHSISGHIVYIDSFCNAITNIPTTQFLEYKKNRKFTITFGNRKHVESSAYYDYYNPKEYDIYLTNGQFGYLEVTINGGELANMASLWVDDEVKINFGI